MDLLFIIIVQVKMLLSHFKKLLRTVCEWDSSLSAPEIMTLSFHADPPPMDVWAGLETGCVFSQRHSCPRGLVLIFPI